MQETSIRTKADNKLEKMSRGKHCLQKQRLSKWLGWSIKNEGLIFPNLVHQSAIRNFLNGNWTENGLTVDIY